MNSEEAKRAVGKSISFRPYSVYTDAIAFGRLQVPPRSISVVVCEALEHYLEKNGFRTPESRQLAELLLIVEELGVDAALRVLQHAARPRNPRKNSRKRRR